MRFMSDVHGHEPDAFDHLLEDVEAMPRAGNPNIEVTMAVRVSSATLASLIARSPRRTRRGRSRR